MKCQHEIEGEDYGTCRRCDALFFRTSGGLWQSYDDGRRFVNYDQWKDPTDYSDDPPEPLPMNVECPLCGAKVGYGCTSRNRTKGSWAAKTHAVRWKAVGVDNPTHEDRHRDYWHYRKLQQDRILAQRSRQMAANSR